MERTATGLGSVCVVQGCSDTERKIVRKCGSLVKQIVGEKISARQYTRRGLITYGGAEIGDRADAGTQHAIEEVGEHFQFPITSHAFGFLERFIEVLINAAKEG